MLMTKYYLPNPNEYFEMSHLTLDPDLELLAYQAFRKGLHHIVDYETINEIMRSTIGTVDLTPELDRAEEQLKIRHPLSDLRIYRLLETITVFVFHHSGWSSESNETKEEILQSLQEGNTHLSGDNGEERRILC